MNIPDDLKNFLKTVDKTKFKNEPYAQKIPKPWGYELKFTPESLPYSGKIEHIEAGKRLSLQIHDQKQETYYLASGKCNLIIENAQGEMDTIELQTGQGYTAEVGQKHRLQALTDCEVFETATPEMGNTYRLEDDYSRSTETEKMRKEPNRGWSN